MDALALTDQERILYGDLFLSCDVDSAGKITGVKAYDLFRSAGLSHEVLLQVNSPLYCIHGASLNAHTSNVINLLNIYALMVS